MQYHLSSRFAPLVAGVLAIILAVGALPVHAANQELPVPKVTIYPGDLIKEEALTTQLFGPGADRLPIIRSRAELVGKVARRTLVPGKPIPANAIRTADAIQQGKSVKIVFQADGLTITGLGVALQSGAVGDLVTVRNVDSGATIRGTVQANGSVKVDGP